MMYYNYYLCRNYFSITLQEDCQDQNVLEPSFFMFMNIINNQFSNIKFIKKKIKEMIYFFRHIKDTEIFP